MTAHLEAAPVDPPGLDLARLTAHLEASRPGMIAGPLRAHVIAGGRSNLTYDVRDGTHGWIVRRPPLGHVLATAHDMSREHRVISALSATNVPVPRTHLYCGDSAVIGAPFYVMDRVTGTAYRAASQLAALGPARTRTISERMIDVLAALHSVDPPAVGLDDFGRSDGFVARQVRRWKTQLDASHSRSLAGAEELHRRLMAAVPADSAPAVVHGDFRLDNLLVNDADEIAAVIDWEMATLGDPLTDVALLLVYRQLATLAGGHGAADASSAPGFLTEAEMLARYSVASGRVLPALDFYRGLACFKLATILEGIHYRHVHGHTVGGGFDSVGSLVEPLIAAGITALEEDL